MINTQETLTATDCKCYHCGEPCPDEPLMLEEKPFCCEGCKMVYEVLNANDLCTYYDLENNPGITLKKKADLDDYSFLDDDDIQTQLLDFIDGNTAKLTFSVPQMHCASCIWLLEKLYKLVPGITSSRVNFLKKEVYITYQPDTTNLRKVVEMMASVGYAPELTLDDTSGRKKKTLNRGLFLRIGVAGFCFGNVMLLSFPEYLGLDELMESRFSRFFGYLNLLLALPVVFYSATGYFRSAIAGLKKRYLNIDVPIALGVVVLFAQSAFDILTQSGPGYVDSLAGLVFFLLIGKWFQDRTYASLSFERDYKAYFPVAVLVQKNDKETSTLVTKLKQGDVMRIRHGELIPADGLVIEGAGRIDYSFVTGESEPIRKQQGDKVFAGGRQQGSSLLVMVEKPVSQSYLTQLWNDAAFTKTDETGYQSLIDKVSHWFTPVILGIATLTAISWLFIEPSMAVRAFTAVLIVACPCALALATPFTLGNALRLLGKTGFYAKSTATVEKLSSATNLVFDKTGTLTLDYRKVTWKGMLTEEEERMVCSLARHSTHPLSKAIAEQLKACEPLPVDDYHEITGKGIEGIINGVAVRIGSPGFCGTEKRSTTTDVCVNINGQLKGCYTFNTLYRPELTRVLTDLQQHYTIALLSGDNDAEKQQLDTMLGGQSELLFRQSPQDKLNYIKQLQVHDKKVIMVGDGLNDAGALQQSDAGIAISDQSGNFTPASDVIMDGSRFHKLPAFLAYTRSSVKAVKGAFALSLLYNAVGLTLAVQGLLSPVVAAILMPVSSVSVVVFGTAITTLLARRQGILQNGD